MDQTIDKNIISDKCTRMPPKLAPIWRYFEEDTNDPSTAICKVVRFKKLRVSMLVSECNGVPTDFAQFRWGQHSWSSLPCT